MNDEDTNASPGTADGPNTDPVLWRHSGLSILVTFARDVDAIIVA